MHKETLITSRTFCNFIVCAVRKDNTKTLGCNKKKIRDKFQLDLNFNKK